VGALALAALERLLPGPAHVSDFCPICFRGPFGPDRCQCPGSGFLAGEGGTLALGIERDPLLGRTNDFVLFHEEFLSVALQDAFELLVGPASHPCATIVTLTPIQGETMQQQFEAINRNDIYGNPAGGSVYLEAPVGSEEPALYVRWQDGPLAADGVRTELENAGLATIEGQHYSATLTSVKGSSRIDWQAIAAKFKPSRQLIAANTTTGKTSTRLNLTARKITH